MADDGGLGWPLRSCNRCALFLLFNRFMLECVIQWNLDYLDFQTTQNNLK